MEGCNERFVKQVIKRQIKTTLVNTINTETGKKPAYTTQQSLSSVMLSVTNINFLLCQMFVEAMDTVAHGRLKMFEHLCVCLKIYGSFCLLGQQN